MKKIFSLFAAVLFAGSMFAGTYAKTAYAAIKTGDVVIITMQKGDKVYAASNDKGTTAAPTAVAVTVAADAITTDATNIIWTVAKDGDNITFKAGDNALYCTNSNNGMRVGSGESNVFSIDGTSGYLYNNGTSRYIGVYNDADWRCYSSVNANIKDQTLAFFVAAGGDTPVEPKEEFYLTGDFRSWAATADAKYKFAATATEGEYKLEAEFEANVNCKAIGLKDGESTKWYPDGMGNDYALEAGAYTIYLRPAGNAGEGWHEGVLKAEKKAALADPTNCAEAREAALSVSANNEEYNGGKVYTIEGYVTEIAFAWASSSMSFWMADTKDGGKVLEAYKCAIADEADAVRVGDKVAVTGKLTKYNTTPEFAQGCTVQMIERAEVVDPVNLGEKTIAEFLQLKNTKDTCVLTGVVKNIVNTTYGNFDLEDETGTVYVYGLLNAAGESKKFAEMDIEEKDILTIKAVYNEFNSTPQAKNAIFVSREKATGTAIDNATVATKAQKMIIDGQLFIIRDGVKFNANGAVVK